MIQIDSDFDGKLDQWQHKSEDDHLLKVEYDKNGDGKIDQIDVFDGNEKPIRVELDRNFDGTLDQVQHYSKDFILKYIENMKNYAYATLVMRGDAYVSAALIMGYSLKNLRINL